MHVIFKLTCFKLNCVTVQTEMVQGPCAHVVLHDRIYVDFTDLLTA
jgi:hypothetical protein